MSASADRLRQRPSWGRICGRLLAGGLSALCALGCAPPKVQTSFLRSVDLVEMTTRMSESFAATPAIAGRTAASPRWLISIDKVANNTNQIIPENEKWAYIGRLRAQLAQSRISDERNLVWIVPPERWPEIAHEIDASAEPRDLRTPPTHLLTATFSALTTTSGFGRTDAYLCAFQLVDLRDGVLVWEDAWEVKRGTAGRTWD
jgi:hypothetical protein